MAPNSMMAILLGMAVGGLVMTLTRAVVILGLGSWIFNVEYSVSSYWQLALVFTLTMVSLYGLGMMSASVYLLLSREAWHISNLAQEPVFLVSGFYFPVKNLGFWIPLLASIIPLTLGLDAVRQLAIPGGSESGFLPVPVEAAILLFLSIVFLASARWLLAYMERLAIREGRLTESRR
jgi:ABC-2 type transport system permease protein